MAYTGEDVLRLLVWEGYAPESFRKSFEKEILNKYGRKIALQVTYVEGSADFYSPIRGREVDLVTLTHHHFNDARFNYIANGLLLPLDTKNISRYHDLSPDLRNVKNFRKDNKVFGVPLCRGRYALVYNTSKVKPAPVDWRSLWAPEHEGTYVIGANEYLYNICTVALAMGYPRELIGRFDELDNPSFKRQLRSFVRNAGGFWVGQDKADDLLGKSLSVGWGDSLNVLRERGENWRFAEPIEGSIAWIDSYAATWALAEKPFLRKVAEEWIDFLLKPDYQVGYIVREISQIPTTTTAKSELSETEKKRLHVDEPNYFSRKHILLPTFSIRDRNGLKQLWKEATNGIKIKTDVKP